jgi:predicted DNA-binding WGR domain protein
MEAFESGARFGEFVVQRRTAGRLVVASNQIAVADPFQLGFGYRVLNRRVPRGRFPVELSIARAVKGKRKGQERVACALVRLGEGTPTGFRIAKAPEMKRRRLLGAGFHGYEVESGSGCFVDAGAARRLEKTCQKAFERGELDPDVNRKLRERLAKQHEPERSWAALTVNRETGANLVAFSAGWGDGAYPSYWGYDDDRRLVALVTDFLVLPTRTDLCREAWSGRSWRLFHYEGDRTDRFWRVRVKGRKQTVEAGVVGEDGEQKTKEFATSDAAFQDAIRRIGEREQRGFFEVTLHSSRLRAAKARSQSELVPAVKAMRPKAKKAKAKQAKAEKPKAKQAKAKQVKAEKAKAEKPKAEKAKAEKPKATKSSKAGKAKPSARQQALRAKAPSARKRRRR